MTCRELDTVVVTKDLSALGLRSGDIGTVVQVYPQAALGWNSSRPREPLRRLRPWMPIQCGPLAAMTCLRCVSWMRPEPTAGVGFPAYSQVMAMQNVA